MKTSVQKLRTLDLALAPEEGRHSHIAAASGLVVDDKNFYVIADDELSMATFPRDGSPGVLTPLFAGALPLEHSKRKKQKPDLESLIKFDEGLLAVPSGSTIQRVRGAFIKSGQPHTVDFSQIYTHLHSSLTELNIEGSAIRNDELILLQRGNGAVNTNALVFLDLQTVRSAITSGQPIPKTSLRAIKLLDLGTLNQVPLGFTDAALGDHDDLWFLAAAESSDSTYWDGQFGGAILGRIDRMNNIASTCELDCAHKPEGLALALDGSHFWIVTDADDSAQPAGLFEVKVDM